MGIENQSDIHYAMPVKNIIYDAMEYQDELIQYYGLDKKKEPVEV